MVQGVDARLEKTADEVGARDVEVGEVGRVRLVEVVVAFPERGARGGDGGAEEGSAC